MSNTQNSVTGLKAFLAEAVTPFHAVKAIQHRLDAAGFTVLDTDTVPEVGGRYYRIANGSSIVALRVGSNDLASAGIALAGAHTDSPTLMVKPKPEKTRQGYVQLGVEVYGGVLLNPWFDRDLSLAGRVSYRAEGVVKSTLVNFEQPVAIIPSLAIHLDREVNQKRSINPQTDILPILGQNIDDWSIRAQLKTRIEAECGVVDEVLDYELCFYDVQQASVIGLDRSLFAAARLDNLLSCYVGIEALLAADGETTALMVCNDHEEVGSLSAVGANGPLLTRVLEQLEPDPARYRAMIEASFMISCDNAHGIHPNFSDRHDDNHGPLLNAGPVIKINSNQRYATNSLTAGYFRTLAQRCSVPVQSFVVRTDMGCGSTIGPITAGETGIKTLDVGVPTFAMHSIRELAGCADVDYLQTVLTHYFSRYQASDVQG